MPKEPREWKTTNAAAVAAGAYWYPFAETSGSPTSTQIDEQFPCRSCVFENNSGETYRVILDPTPISSSKEWTVPDGTSFTLKSDEGLFFHQVVIFNAGALESAIGELKFTARNY